MVPEYTNNNTIIYGFTKYSRDVIIMVKKLLSQIHKFFKQIMLFSKSTHRSLLSFTRFSSCTKILKNAKTRGSTHFLQLDYWLPTALNQNWKKLPKQNKER